eukprot:CAMPEP_0181294266 /NCGR_PEP_ID=MMETSP1101-20121128/3505_1 /TAXON_ID=46948 /ORGANISM="Rhodomonas abbreviata, Strain Caron Lab Isolate" /LENGTH=726 /DNA_ID=CAMNT_0023398905 /DNA_START=50 /DNA_END=2227 /DNA_ORIENTATION=+
MMSYGGDDSTMSTQKMNRLAELREEARALEEELEEDRKRVHTAPLSQLSVASTPRMKASRIPRREAVPEAESSAIALHRDPSSADYCPKSLAASNSKTVEDLRDQIRANYNTIQLAFHRADTEKSRRVSRENFQSILNQCMIPISRMKVDDIFNLVDQDEKGRIDYGDFLSMFIIAAPRRAENAKWKSGRTVLPPALPTPPPGTGFSRPMTSRSTLSTRAGRRENHLQEGTFTLMSEVNDYVRYYRRKFDELFDAADLEATKQVSKGQALRIFRAVGYPLTAAQLDEVLVTIHEPVNVTTIQYPTVLDKLSGLALDRPELFDHLASVHFAPTHLNEIIARRMRDRYSSAIKLLVQEDSEGTGDISRTSLLRILKGMGLEISETQLEEVLIQMGLWPSTTSGGTVNCHEFIQRFVREHPIPSFDEFHARSIISRIPKEIASAPTMSVHQLLMTLQEKMQMYIKQPRDMFLKLDVDKDGALSREELTRAFRYFNLYPTPNEIDDLLKLVDAEGTGIDYKQFLEKLSPKRSYKFMDAQKTQALDRYKTYLPKGTQSPVPRPRTGHTLLSPPGLCAMIRKQVHPNLRQVSIMLNEKDLAASAVIPRNGLLQVLRKVDIYVTMDQMNEALEEMGIPRSETINLHQFLAAVGEGASPTVSPGPTAFSRQATAGVRTSAPATLLKGPATASFFKFKVPGSSGGPGLGPRASDRESATRRGSGGGGVTHRGRLE